MIPSFPEFAPIALEHKPEVDAVLARLQPLASEYTFTNLYAWAEAHHSALARFGDGLLVCQEQAGQIVFLQPLLTEGDAAVTACLVAARRLERVGEDFLAAVACGGLSLDIREDRDHFDYVYRVAELIDLRGPKYHDKKNLLQQFRKQYPHYRYHLMTPEIIERCLAFQHAWCEDRHCEEHDGLLREHCAIRRMLSQFTALRLQGGAIEIDGRIVALTLGEPLNAETFVIHIEKAWGNITGLYQAIHWEFLRHAAPDFPYVNREQDLGIPGLRRAKTSYNPVRMIKKYLIEQQEG